jgi:hypothetical protein
LANRPGDLGPGRRAVTRDSTGIAIGRALHCRRGVRSRATCLPCDTKQ